MKLLLAILICVVVGFTIFWIIRSGYKEYTKSEDGPIELATAQKVLEGWLAQSGDVDKFVI